MERFDTIASLRSALDSARRAGRSVGVVPTMGALHDGHASLIRAAVEAGHETIVTTIFVNPLQFGPKEDLAAYPRDLEGDSALAAAAGAGLLFTPSAAEMYPFGPSGVLTSVAVRELTGVLDGLARPGHFDGVSTVVAKLFNITGPCRAYFGEKDFQQLAVVRRMVADLSFAVDVVGCAIVREANGLAMSSRNRYLSSEQRSRAAVIQRALQVGASLVGSGASGAIACSEMRAVLDAEPIVSSIDYVACVDPTSLQPVDVVTAPVRLLIACRVGPARLIDNVEANPPPL